MNAVTKTQAAQPAPQVQTPKRTPAEAFMAAALPKSRQEAIKNILPGHVKPERFLRNFAIAINQHPKLLNCDPVAVFNEVSKAAALGLYMDPQLGEAYLITGFSNGRAEPQLRLGYRGLIKLARQSGEIKSIYAHEVHEKDVCRITLGDEKSIYHEPSLMAADRGPIVMYYAVVKYLNGETDFEPMTMAQIHGIRDRSDGWRAFKNGKIKSTPWGTDEGEMAKKTVLRRLLKRVPASPELADAIAIEDRAEFSSGIEEPVTPRLIAAQALHIESTKTAQIEIIDDDGAENDASGDETLTEQGENTGAENAEIDTETRNMFDEDDDFPGDRK